MSRRGHVCSQLMSELSFGSMRARVDGIVRRRRRLAARAGQLRSEASMFRRELMRLQRVQQRLQRLEQRRLGEETC